MNQTINHSFEPEILHMLASMEFLPLVILLSTLSFVSSQSQDLPDRYFINCGSNSDINFIGKSFIGDDNRTTFSLSGDSNAVNNNPASNYTSDIYQTARVFTQKSWYELEADANNTFVMVHLHFAPFLYKAFDLPNSIFDVSVSGFSMLSNFSVRESSVVIKELIIPIQSNHQKFQIEFTPSGGSSLAFVNAIEAFTIPNEQFRHRVCTFLISPAGVLGCMYNISSSYAFNPVYRINVGGQSINVDRDALRRNWIRDDKFIFKSEPAARNVSSRVMVNYKDGFSSRYDAPDDVYKTARQLNNSLVNITWNFEVNKNSRFLVRAHFCDIISQGLSDDAFNFFIYSHYNWSVKPGEKVHDVNVPFYNDFVVDSLDSGFVNVSIGAGASSGTSQPVFLNGLEIMELLKSSGVDGFQNDRKTSKEVYIVVGCAVGGVVCVLLIGFFIGLRYRKSKRKKTESNTVPSHGWSSYTSTSIDFTDSNPIPKLNLNLRFQLAYILQATNGFDEKLVIGKGGFGKVYRGTFPGGKTVAVKRAEIGHGQGRSEFETEVMVLSKIQHKHLVALIGYCDEKSEMILVYEFMENGTLQDHLYNTGKDIKMLSWNQRLEICISAARGLHYLHTGSGIIHRDVKSTNILLDRNYIAKVADFGISLLENVEESEMAVKGSFGYMDPEYITCMTLTQKSDVYSFGVVLLEVVCARPAVDITLPLVNLAEWAINQIKDGMVEYIIDPFLVGKANPNSLMKFLGTAERCLKNTGDERPSMLDVLWDLEYAQKLQQIGVDKEAYEYSTMNTSMQLSILMIDHLPSNHNDDDSRVNDSSVSSYPSESQVFSKLKIDEAR